MTQRELESHQASKSAEFFTTQETGFHAVDVEPQDQTVDTIRLEIGEHLARTMEREDHLARSAGKQLLDKAVELRVRDAARERVDQQKEGNFWLSSTPLTVKGFFQDVRGLFETVKDKIHFATQAIEGESGTIPERRQYVAQQIWSQFPEMRDAITKSLSDNGLPLEKSGLLHTTIERRIGQLAKAPKTLVQELSRQLDSHDHGHEDDDTWNKKALMLKKMMVRLIQLENAEEEKAKSTFESSTVKGFFQDVHGLFDERYDRVGLEIQAMYGVGETIESRQYHVADQIWEQFPEAHEVITEFLTEKKVPLQDNISVSRIWQLSQAPAHVLEALKRKLVKEEILDADSKYKAPYFPPGKTVQPVELFDRLIQLRTIVQQEHEKRFGNTVYDSQRLQGFLKEIQEIDKKNKDEKEASTKTQKEADHQKHEENKQTKAHIQGEIDTHNIRVTQLAEKLAALTADEKKLTQLKENEAALKEELDELWSHLREIKGTSPVNQDETENRLKNEMEAAKRIWRNHDRGVQRTQRLLDEKLRRKNSIRVQFYEGKLEGDRVEDIEEIKRLREELIENEIQTAGAKEEYDDKKAEYDALITSEKDAKNIRKKRESVLEAQVKLWQEIQQMEQQNIADEKNEIERQLKDAESELEKKKQEMEEHREHHGHNDGAHSHAEHDEHDDHDEDKGLFTLITKKILKDHQLLELDRNPEGMALVARLMQIFHEHGGGEEGYKKLTEVLETIHKSVPHDAGGHEASGHDEHSGHGDGHKDSHGGEHKQEHKEDEHHHKGNLEKVQEKCAALKKIHQELSEAYRTALALGNSITHYNEDLRNARSNKPSEKGPMDPGIATFTQKLAEARDRKEALGVRIANMEQQYRSNAGKLIDLLAEKKPHGKLKEFQELFKDSKNMPESTEQQVFGPVDSHNRGKFIQFFSHFNADSLVDMIEEIEHHSHSDLSSQKKLTAEEFHTLLERHMLLEDYPNIPLPEATRVAHIKIRCRQAAARDNRQLHRTANREMAEYLGTEFWGSIRLARVKKWLTSKLSPERMMTARYIIDMASFDEKNKDLGAFYGMPVDVTLTELRQRSATVTPESLKKYEIKLKKILEQNKTQNPEFTVETYDRDGRTLETLIEHLQIVREELESDEVVRLALQKVRNQTEAGKEATFDEAYLAVAAEKRKAREEREAHLLEELFGANGEDPSFIKKLFRKFLQKEWFETSKTAHEAMKGMTKDEKKEYLSKENLEALVGAGIGAFGTAYAAKETLESVRHGARLGVDKVLRPAAKGVGSALNFAIGKPARFLWNKGVVPTAKLSGRVIAYPFKLAGRVVSWPFRAAYKYLKN